MKRTLITIIVIVTLMLTFTSCNKEASDVQEQTVDTTKSTIIEITDGLEGSKKLSIENPKVKGPTGIETYFNEDMSSIVKAMKNGFVGDYWEREDGVKMFGEYVLCKCRYNSNEYHPNLPIGTIIPTTVGNAIVCSNDTQDDICVAVIW